MTEQNQTTTRHRRDRRHRGPHRAATPRIDETDDTEGHFRKDADDAEDDVEGHVRRDADEAEDDTEGHIRRDADQAEDDVEGHFRR